MSGTPDRLTHMGGVPVGPTVDPTFGKVWWVDGTNGAAGNDGRTSDSAFSTVQLAVTAQIASTTSLGDVIYVMPGTYSEGVIATTFVKVQLIGATCGGEPTSVIIHNSVGHAFVAGEDATWTTTMANSALRNIAFYTPGTSNTEYAAVRIDTIVGSIIDSCKFLGNYQASASEEVTVGLQLGPLTGTYNSFHEFSTISRCEFGTSGSRGKEVDTGIRVGAEVVTTPANTGFKSMKIVDNVICGEMYGINLWTGASSCGGSLIARNTIHSHQGGTGAGFGIISQSTDGTDLLMQIHDNRVNAITAATRNFSTHNLHGNTLSIGNANPVGQYPPAA